MACIITRDGIVTQDVAWIIPLEIEAVVMYSNNSLFDLILWLSIVLHGIVQCLICIIFVLRVKTWSQIQ